MQSYRFGAGRYLQEPGILCQAGSEISRYGKKAYVIGSRTAVAVTQQHWEASFKAAGLAFVLEQYGGFPGTKKADQVCRSARMNNCDVIVGIGGGKIMDLAKATAARAKLPVVLMPTSSATCAAYSPLSVMYTEDGKCTGYEHFEYEVTAVLVDLNIMAGQPPRLLAAGIMDAMAKYVEIANGESVLSIEENSIGKYSAYMTAKYMYELLEQYGEQAYWDVSARRLTKAVEDVVFLSIALTGITSALMRGRQQTALAHKIYECMRTSFYKETRDYLHGEIVATGLICQLYYNRNEKAIEELKAFMQRMQMPMSLQELGLVCDKQQIEVITEILAGTEFVADDKAHHQLLDAALRQIYE